MPARSSRLGCRGPLPSSADQRWHRRPRIRSMRRAISVASRRVQEEAVRARATDDQCVVDLRGGGDALAIAARTGHPGRGAGLDRDGRDRSGSGIPRHLARWRTRRSSPRDRHLGGLSRRAARRPATVKLRRTGVRVTVPPAVYGQQWNVQPTACIATRPGSASLRHSASSGLLRSRARQRCRVGPIAPIGMPSTALIHS